MRPPPTISRARTAYAGDSRVAFGYLFCIAGLCMVLVCGVLAIVMPDRLGVLLFVGLMGACNTIYGAGFVVFYGRRSRDSRRTPY